VRTRRGEAAGFATFRAARRIARMLLSARRVAWRHVATRLDFKRRADATRRDDGRGTPRAHEGLLLTASFDSSESP